MLRQNSIMNGLTVKVGLSSQFDLNTKLFIMKKLLTLLLATLPFYGLLAQDNSTSKAKTSVKKLYFQSGGGFGSRSGSYSELGLQGILNNKWSVGLSYQELNMKPQNLPADYRPETGTVLFIPYTHDITVEMKLFSITAGKYFQLGRNSWVTAEGGFSFVDGEKATFQRITDAYPGWDDPLSSFFGVSSRPSNYQTAIEKKTTFGGMLKADINWVFCSFMGIGAGMFANFNAIQSPIGFQVKLMLGAMGRHKKIKNNKN
jgi:hypothetical protein